MNAVLVGITGTLWRRLQCHEELELDHLGILICGWLEEPRKGVGVGRNEGAELFTRETAAQRPARSISEIKIDKDGTLCFVLFYE